MHVDKYKHAGSGWKRFVWRDGGIKPKKSGGKRNGQSLCWTLVIVRVRVIVIVMVMVIVLIIFIVVVIVVVASRVFSVSLVDLSQCISDNNSK